MQFNSSDCCIPRPAQEKQLECTYTSISLHWPAEKAGGGNLNYILICNRFGKVFRDSLYGSIRVLHGGKISFFRLLSQLFTP